MVWFLTIKLLVQSTLAPNLICLTKRIGYFFVSLTNKKCIHSSLVMIHKIMFFFLKNKSAYHNDLIASFLDMETLYGQYTQHTWYDSLSFLFTPEQWCLKK